MKNKFLRGLLNFFMIFCLVLISSAPVLAASSAPVVSSQYPKSGATGVSISVKPYINFSKNIDSSTVNSDNIKLMCGSTPVQATVALSGKKKVIITPDATLDDSTTYYILVGTGVKDTSSNYFDNPYGSDSSSQFTTAVAKKPTVTSQYPSKGSKNVSFNVNPYVVFSKDMDYTTIDSDNVTLMEGSNPVETSVSLSGTNKAIIIPDTPLKGNTSYYILVGLGVKDSRGNQMDKAYGSATSSKFTTGDATSPEVKSIFPADGDISLPPNVQPCIVFSKAMDSSTINSDSIQLSSDNVTVAASVVLSGGTKAVVTPKKILNNSTTYTLDITTDVKDIVGNTLESPFSITFTTGANINPEIVSQYPQNDATSIPVNVQPCIVFSQSMDSSTINTNNIQLLNGTIKVSTTVALYGKNTAIVIPKSPLTGATTYTLTVSKSVKDKTGNTLESSATFSFETVEQGDIEVYSQFPQNGATDVSPDTKPCIVFSQPMDSSTLTSNNIKLMSGTTSIKVTVALHGKNTVILTPKTYLTAGADYFITVNTKVKDLNGNTLTDIYGSESTSGFSIKDNPPVVLSQYPQDNTTGVSVNINPLIVFSKAMDEETINSTNIKLMSGDTPVSASVTLTGSNTAVISPDHPLDQDSIYYLLVETGVKDINGISLAETYGSDVTSDFTTDVPDTAPIILYQYPLDTETGVYIDSQPCIVFSKAMETSTINSTNIRLLLEGTTPVNITVSLYGKNTVIIIPQNNLIKNTVYSIVVTTEVKDTGGNSLESTSTTTFTTLSN